MHNTLQRLSDHTEALRADVNSAAREVRQFSKRLELILSQAHKNITIRDGEFTESFNQFCLGLRVKLDELETVWAPLRAEVRSARPGDFDQDCALSAKGLASKAKTLSRSADELTTAYSEFCKFYRSYTESKINVWLLTSCCNDINALTDKILFMSRDVAKKTERNRGNYVG